MFEEYRARTRTNQQFHNMEDTQHHVAVTKLTENPFISDMVMSFPIDSMHTLDLGVIKKLLMLQKKRNMFDVGKANEFIKKASKYVPSDFVRKPRSFSLIDQWKATEFREFGTYFGPVMYLESGLNSEEYDNFLHFFIAYRLVMGEHGIVLEERLEQADALLNVFVRKFKETYSELSYNFHTLLHVAEVCRVHGPLHKYTAYKYENFYQLLRAWIRKPSHLFEQIWTRWSQTRGMVLRKKNKKKSIDSHIIDATQRNNCVMDQNGQIFLIQKKSLNFDGLLFEARKVNRRQPLFSHPVCSTTLKIFVISETDVSDDVTGLTLDSIEAKMFRIPYKNNFVVMPVLHY